MPIATWPRLQTAAALSLAILAGCAAADAEHTPAAPGPVEVAVVTLRAEQVALKTELVGRTAPYRSAEVRPQVT
ncbi:MAG: efflux transporter periplasmic adaptor subunit, partial [Polyangiales bacterium]